MEKRILFEVENLEVQKLMNSSDGAMEERLESMESLLRQVATQQTLEKIETKVDKMSAHSSKLFGMMQGGHNGAQSVP